MIKKIKDKNVSLLLSDRVGTAVTFIDRIRCETMHNKQSQEEKEWVSCLRYHFTLYTDTFIMTRKINDYFKHKST